VAADAVLGRGQALAESRMVDTCTIRRALGWTTDDFSGVRTATYLNPDPYIGKCRIKQVDALPENHDVGQDYVVLSRLQLHLPVAVTGIQVGDEVTITASLYDPDLPGKVFQVRGPAVGSAITARRFEVTERAG
jgi:hypothetical protein